MRPWQSHTLEFGLLRFARNDIHQLSCDEAIGTFRIEVSYEKCYPSEFR